MSLRKCIAVKNVGGICRCARYGPPGSTNKTFKQLCREAGLKIKVGSTDLGLLGGKNMRKKRYFSDVDDLSYLESDLSFLDELDFVNIEDLKELAVIGSSAAAAGIAWSLLEGKFLAGKIQNDYLRAGIKAGVGVLAATLLKRYNRNIALGIGAGLVGSAFGDIARKFIPLAGLPQAGIEYTLPEPEEMPVAGYLSQGEEDETGVPTEGVEEEKLYGVEEEKLYGASVEEEKLLGIDDYEEREVIF